MNFCVISEAFEIVHGERVHCPACVVWTRSHQIVWRALQGLSRPYHRGQQCLPSAQQPRHRRRFTTQLTALTHTETHTHTHRDTRTHTRTHTDTRTQTQTCTRLLTGWTWVWTLLSLYSPAVCVLSVAGWDLAVSVLPFTWKLTMKPVYLRVCLSSCCCLCIKHSAIYTIHKKPFHSDGFICAKQSHLGITGDSEWRRLINGTHLDIEPRSDSTHNAPLIWFVYFSAMVYIVCLFTYLLP